MNLLQSIIFTISSLIATISPSTNYIEGAVGQPRSFLPSQTVTQTDKTISSLIYRGLFKYDIYGTLVPDLADTWEISEDGLVYTIKLKENQKWTDGKPITSDDLIYTAFKISDLSGVATDRVDDFTVRYTLPNKFSPFLSLLTVGVMPANAEETNNPLVPISSGKFRVLRVEKSGPIIKQVTLLNTTSEENIRKLTYRFYAVEDELFTAAKLGEIDGFLANEIKDMQNYQIYKYPLQGVYYALYFNLKNEKLTDLEFRQKLEKALPVSDLIIYSGISVEGPISRSIYTDTSLDFDKYDKALPEEVLNKSLTITVPDIKEHVDLARKIADMWEDELGLHVEVNTVDPMQINEQIIDKRDFEVLFYGQEVGRDPDRYVNWHSTQSDAPGLNLSGFTHVRSDRALEEARNANDNDARIKHYHEFQKVVTEQVPVIFLYHPYANYYVSKYIEGIGEKYTFTLSDRFLDFSNWKRIQTF